MTQSSSSPATIDIIIIEDDAGIRSAYEGLINATPGMRCIGSYHSCEAALERLQERQPHVLLMDIGLPGMSGIDGAREIKARWPAIDILMQTVYDDDGRIFDSICAGASGYILKNAEPGQLVQAVRDIREGAPMSASIARRILGMLRSGSMAPRHRSAAGAEAENLSARELDILQSLVEGLSYKRIAEKHFISIHTVHAHIKKIYEKLQVHSKSAAVSKALKHGFF